MKSLIAAIRATFNVSVAEVDHQELWQRTAIGVAVVGAEEYHLRKVAQEVERLVDRWVEVEVDRPRTLRAPRGGLSTAVR